MALIRLKLLLGRLLLRCCALDAFHRRGCLRCRRADSFRRQLTDEVAVAHAHPDDFFLRPVCGTVKVVHHRELQQSAQVILLDRRLALEGQQILEFLTRRRFQRCGVGRPINATENASRHRQPERRRFLRRFNREHCIKVERRRFEPGTNPVDARERDRDGLSFALGEQRRGIAFDNPFHERGSCGNCHGERLGLPGDLDEPGIRLWRSGRAFVQGFWFHTVAQMCRIAANSAFWRLST